MAVTGVLTRHCSTCGEEHLFEPPPCRDGHRGDCPEWACVECGAAVLYGLPVLDTLPIDDLPLDDLPWASASSGLASTATSPSHAA
jgi:hypothetical protein